MKAILLALAGFFCFTLMDLSIKWSLQSYPLLQVTFFNCLFALLGLLIWIYPRYGILKTAHPGMHLLRASSVLVADLLAFYSFGKVPLAEAYTLILTMPLFTALFAFLLKHERLHPRQLLFSLLGFIGICLILAPGFATFQIALLAALGCAVIESLGFLLISRYRDREPPQTFAVYGLSLVVMVTGLFTLLDYQPMVWQAIGISLGGGLCYAVATALIVTAFHQGSPSAVSSMQYSQLVWGMLFAFLLWQEVPTLPALGGGILIAVSGLWLLQYQRNKAS